MSLWCCQDRRLKVSMKKARKMKNGAARISELAAVFLLFVFAACGYAAPTCKPEKILYREVGLCNPDGNVSKWDCPNCPPGSGLSVECGRTYKAGTKVHCVPCIKGYSYSTTYDIGQCKPCGKCQENEDQTGNCAVDKNTINCTCKVGYYREKVLSKDCKPCSWCCDDGSNNKMPECNHQQVQPGKQCSFQDNQLCAPTTTTTNTPTQTTTHQKSISVTTVPATTRAEDSGKGNSSNTVSTDSQSESTTKSIVPIKNTPTASKKKDFWITNILFPIVIGLSSVIIVLLILAGLVIYLKSWRKKSGKKPIPTDSVDVSMSTTEQGFDETGALTSLLENNGHVDLRPNDGTAAFHADQGLQEISIGTAAEGNNNTASLSTHLLQECEDGRSGPSKLEVGPSRQQSSAPSRNREHEIYKEYIHRTYGPKVENMPHDVIHEVCLRLNLEQPKGNDYLSVASKVGMEYFERMSLRTQDNPMDVVFQKIVTLAMEVNEFVDILYQIDRHDVVKKMHEMAESR